MASEIRVSLRATVTGANGITATIAPSPSATVYDQASACITAGGTQSVGTSSENLSKGDIPASDVGYCYLRNNSATNFVTVTTTIRLGPGELAFFKPAPSTEVACQADTAACWVDYQWVSR